MKVMSKVVTFELSGEEIEIIHRVFNLACVLTNSVKSPESSSEVIDERLSNLVDLVDANYNFVTNFYSNL